MQVGWDKIRHFGPILAISQKRFKPWPTIISMQSCTSCIVSRYCDILVERKVYLTRKNVMIFWIHRSIESIERPAVLTQRPI